MVRQQPKIPMQPESHEKFTCDDHVTSNDENNNLPLYNFPIFMHEIKIYKTPTILSFDFNLLLLILHLTLNIGLYRYICYENHVITSTFQKI